MGDRYAKERSNPTVGRCKRLALTFTGKSLIFSGGSKSRAYPAVSGKPLGKGFVYDASRQHAKDLGPIPAGKYWIKPSELWSRGYVKGAYWRWASLLKHRDSAHHRSAWGDYRITIHPYPGTKTFGRGGFFLHGGVKPGSIGCIDLTKHMDEFVKALKSEVGDETNCYIPLTVKY